MIDAKLPVPCGGCPKIAAHAPCSQRLADQFKQSTMCKSCRQMNPTQMQSMKPETLHWPMRGSGLGNSNLVPTWLQPVASRGSSSCPSMTRLEAFGTAKGVVEGMRDCGKAVEVEKEARTLDC